MMNEIIDVGGLDGKVTISEKTVSTSHGSYEVKSIATLVVKHSYFAHLAAFLCMSVALIALGSVFWQPLGATPLPHVTLIGILAIAGFAFFFWLARTRYMVEAYSESGATLHPFRGVVTLPTARTLVATFSRAKALSDKSGDEPMVRKV